MYHVAVQPVSGLFIWQNWNSAPTNKLPVCPSPCSPSRPPLCFQLTPLRAVMVVGRGRPLTQPSLVLRAVRTLGVTHLLLFRGAACVLGPCHRTAQVAVSRELCALEPIEPGVLVVGPYSRSVVWGLLHGQGASDVGKSPGQLPVQAHGCRRRDTQGTSAPSPGSVGSPALHVTPGPLQASLGPADLFLIGAPQGNGVGCSFSLFQCVRRGFLSA